MRRRPFRAPAKRDGRTLARFQLGMFSNCARPSGFAQSRRRLVNISSTGSMPCGWSRLPIVTKIVPGKLSRLLVNTVAHVLRSTVPLTGQLVNRRARHRFEHGRRDSSRHHSSDQKERRAE
jgi:hypothetical protein